MFYLKFFLSFILTLALTPSFAEPTNLHLIKKELETYHDSGLYEKELAKVIQEASTYILAEAQLNKQRKNPEKLAIVLDIDETSLSNYPYMVKRNFGGHRHDLHQEILAASAPAIAPTFSLYQKVRQEGIQIFFVTGRPQAELEATAANLKRAGFTNWAGLYLRPDNYLKGSIIPFKTQTRANITKQGYTILATIGDQDSDLKGGFARRGFKLPNPYYYLP